MANAVTEIPAITDNAILTPQQKYADGLQLAKEVDRINRKKGKPTHYAAYFRKTYGKAFGGK